MKFAIAVHGAPFSTEASATALRFVRAALDSGHQISRVFFYHDGVHSGSALAVAPQDEAEAVAGWVELSDAHQVELTVCISAAAKRGLVDEAERRRLDLPGANLHPAFTLVGLGQLIDAIVTSDRFVTFAA